MFQTELLSKDDITKNDVMDCLIKNKNDPEMKSELKCRAAVEHFQLISMNDYRFTLSFKEACRSTVIRYCPKSRTKPEVYIITFHTNLLIILIKSVYICKAGI